SYGKAGRGARADSRSRRGLGKLLRGGCPALHRLPFRASSRRCSQPRQARARMVIVGFLNGLLAKTAASATITFGQSQIWPYAFVTPSSGLALMRATPIS